MTIAEKAERKKGVFLSIMLIVLTLDAVSGFIYYLLVVTGYLQSVLSIPSWVNQLSLGWIFIDILLIVGIWMWKKWALITEGILLVIGFIFGLYLEIPIDGLVMTPILFSILLIAIRPKWKFLD